RIVYEQSWKRNWRGKHPTSKVVQTYLPPNEIWFEFLEGLHRGTKVHTLLSEHAEGTLVEEEYHIPLPAWRWLRPLIRPFMMPSIERIWNEDLQVGVCYGGYPGIPNLETKPSGTIAPRALSVERTIGKASAFPKNRLHRLQIDGNEIVLFFHEGEYLALDGICPHTGGFLWIGKVEGACIVCPWHGAKFDVTTGANVCGTAKRGLTAYSVAEEGANLILRSISPPRHFPK
ncbi:MAG: Rieske (2Fe-2S) protein, partial [Armatimonadetes bacterium]|nr:Rieske (2Fe-2S) protein [Armatimonadota bacterium]